MRHLLVLSGGHPYEAEPFAALLGSLQGWRVEHLVHPEAEALVADGAADHADALLFYDMPGFTFADGTVATRPPSAGFVAAIKAHFRAGIVPPWGAAETASAQKLTNLLIELGEEDLVGDGTHFDPDLFYSKAG